MVGLQTIVNDPDGARKILEQQKSEQVFRRSHCDYLKTAQDPRLLNIVEEIYLKDAENNHTDLLVLDYKTVPDNNNLGTKYRQEAIVTHYRFTN